jgi:hypothetical protein
MKSCARLELHLYGDTISARATTHFYTWETYAGLRAVIASGSTHRKEEQPSTTNLAESGLMAPCHAFISRPSLWVVSSRSSGGRDILDQTEFLLSWMVHSSRKNDIIRLIGLPTRPSEKPASPTLTGSHPALTTLSTARAPTPVNWVTEDGSVAHAFLSYLWRSSSTVLLQRAFDKPLRDPMLCWQHRGKILLHRFSKFSPGERHARVWRMRPLSSV